LFGARKVEVIQTTIKDGNDIWNEPIWRESTLSYSRSFLATVASILLIVPSTIIGSVLGFATSATSENYHEMQTAYQDAVDKKKVINKPLDQKRVVIIHDDCTCEDMLRRLLENRYLPETEFTFIATARETDKESDKELPKGCDYDLFFIQKEHRYFFENEGVFADKELDLFQSDDPHIRNKTLVALRSSMNHNFKSYVNCDSTSQAALDIFKDCSFQIETIPTSYIRF
jgi:hypothetical protein